MKLYKAWMRFFIGTLIVIILLSALMMFIFYQTLERQETVKLESVEAFVIQQNISEDVVDELTRSLAEQFQQHQINAMIVLLLFYAVFIFAAILVFIRFAKVFSRRAATEFKIVDNLAQVDALTQVYNRRYMEEGLTSIIEILSRSNGEVAILLIDLDCFKLYNDTYGHHAGDICLKKVAEGLKQSLSRAKDFVARYGGEEFIIVLPGTGELGATLIAERVQETIRTLAIEHKSSTVAKHVTVSIGIASGKIPIKKRHWSDYVSVADKALYHSKKKGRNRYTHFLFE